MDDQVGVVLDALDDSSLKENTIVVFASDHGWQMGEKEYLYKNSPWDESTRIPFIIRDPKLSKSNDKVAHAVSLIDIFPTLIDLCNLKGSTVKNAEKVQLDGFSLKPFLENVNTKDWNGPEGALTVLGAGINKPIEGVGFSNNPGALWHIQITADLDASYVKKQNYSYRTKHWRYILYRNGKEELYNHTNDSYEWNNLAHSPNHAAIKQELKSQVLNMIK
jgi:iduronate 2-sulfatase